MSFKVTKEYLQWKIKGIDGAIQKTRDLIAGGKLSPRYKAEHEFYIKHLKKEKTELKKRIKTLNQ